MLAVYATHPAPDDPLSALKIGEMPEPTMPDGWVRVKVSHASLNRHDLFTLRGITAHPEGITYPMILGNDAAGTLDDNTPVVIYPMMGSADWRGDETLDPAWHIPGEFIPGTFAAYAVVPKRNAIPLPSNLSPLHASVLGTAWLTAYRALFTKSGLRAGQTVLVQGASGGMATALSSSAAPLASRFGPPVGRKQVERIRLGRLTRALLPPQASAEAIGLLALMLLHDARRAARLDEAGDLVLLEDQDRTRWDQKQIGEALPLVDETFRGGPGPFALQAALAAQHCQAKRPEAANWHEILRLYDLLERVQPSPIVALNRAVAVAMVDGPRAGLALIDELAEAGDLDGYHLLHAARADLLRRSGDNALAARSYERALELVNNDSERRFLENRLGEVQKRTGLS